MMMANAHREYLTITIILSFFIVLGFVLL